MSHGYTRIRERVAFETGDGDSALVHRGKVIRLKAGRALVESADGSREWFRVSVIERNRKETA